jgi:hypothetical protein
MFILVASAIALDMSEVERRRTARENQCRTKKFNPAWYLFGFDPEVRTIKSSIVCSFVTRVIFFFFLFLVLFWSSAAAAAAFLFFFDKLFCPVGMHGVALC